MADAFLSSYNFAVYLSISGLGGDEGLVSDPTGAFSEVSGLEYQIDMEDVLLRGIYQGMRRLVTKTTQPELVLKRGLTADDAFWRWIQRCTDGTYPLPYINGTLVVHGPAADRSVAPPATWRFFNGVATRVVAPGLNAADSNAVPIEELHIAHEGLRREPA